MSDLSKGELDLFKALVNFYRDDDGDDYSFKVSWDRNDMIHFLASDDKEYIVMVKEISE